MSYLLHKQKSNDRHEAPENLSLEILPFVQCRCSNHKNDDYLKSGDRRNQTEISDRKNQHNPGERLKKSQDTGYGYIFGRIYAFASRARHCDS